MAVCVAAALALGCAPACVRVAAVAAAGCSGLACVRVGCVPVRLRACVMRGGVCGVWPDVKSAGGCPGAGPCVPTVAMRMCVRLGALACLCGCVRVVLRLAHTAEHLHPDGLAFAVKAQG